MSNTLTDTDLDALANALSAMCAEYSGYNVAGARLDLAHALAAVTELRQRRAAQPVALADSERERLAAIVQRVLDSADAQNASVIVDALAAAWSTPAPVPQQKVPPQDELELLLGDITRLLRCGNMLTYNDTGDDRPFCVTERTDRDDAVEVDGATLAEAVGAAVALGMGEGADSACPCGHTTPQPAPDADARALGRLAVAWRDAQLTRRKLVRSDNYEAYAAADDAEDMARDAFDAEIRRQVRMG